MYAYVRGCISNYGMGNADKRLVKPEILLVTPSSILGLVMILWLIMTPDSL